jgi:hypothetical protein
VTFTDLDRDERGGSQSVAAVLVAPVVLFAILAVFQASVWYSGRQATLSAAQAAAEAERVLHPAGGAGQAAASSIASQRGLEDVNVSVSRGAETVTVVVSARVPMFVDIGVGRFTERASMARERVTQ